MSLKAKRLLVFDSNSVIHRAYHALPPLTTKNGELVNAVYGFLLVFLRVIKEFQPDFIAATFDFPGPTFRHKKYKKYKAKRPPTPEALYGQIPKVKEFLKAFGIPVFEKEGFEADDIISTISYLASKKQAIPRTETIIISGDLDTLQMIDSATKVYVLRRGVKDVVLYDKELVRKKFQGLNPKQLLDFKALRGDPSDNIPGVTGIGEKTAILLLLNFGTLENLYKEIEGDSKKAQKVKPRTKEILMLYKEQGFLSRELAQVQKNVPIKFNLKQCLFDEENYDKEEVLQVFKKFEFYSLIKRLPGAEEDPPSLTRENLKLW